MQQVTIDDQPDQRDRYAGLMCSPLWLWTPGGAASALLSSGGKLVVEQRHTKGGERVILVAKNPRWGRGEVRCELDADHGWAPRRVELTDRSARDVWEVKKFTLVDGRWFPAEGRYTGPNASTDFKVTRWHVNRPIPAEKFGLPELPKGLRVFDHGQLIDAHGESGFQRAGGPSSGIAARNRRTRLSRPDQRTESTAAEPWLLPNHTAGGSSVRAAQAPAELLALASGVAGRSTWPEQSQTRRPEDAQAGWCRLARLRPAGAEGRDGKLGIGRRDLGGCDCILAPGDDDVIAVLPAGDFFLFAARQQLGEPGPCVGDHAKGSLIGIEMQGHDGSRRMAGPAWLCEDAGGDPLKMRPEVGLEPHA